MNYLPRIATPMSIAQATQTSPLVLAFVGDSVHSLLVRSKLSVESDAKTGTLHKLATAEVKAVHQAVLANALVPLLTAEELAIFKRARNSKLNSTAKHAELSEYRRATGWEAVVGYLYLTGQNERLAELVESISKEEV